MPKIKDLATGQEVDPDAKLSDRADATYVTPAEVGDPLAKNPDAMECGACMRMFIPEKVDGVLIVNVLRVEGDAPGTPGLALCDECFESARQQLTIRRDSIKVH